MCKGLRIDENVAAAISYLSCKRGLCAKRKSIEMLQCYSNQTLIQSLFKFRFFKLTLQSQIVKLLLEDAHFTRFRELINHVMITWNRESSTGWAVKRVRLRHLSRDLDESLMSYGLIIQRVTWRVVIDWVFSHWSSSRCWYRKKIARVPSKGSSCTMFSQAITGWYIFCVILYFFRYLTLDWWENHTSSRIWGNVADTFAPTSISLFNSLFK
jgi:hypothetical protein